jgi:hypothetical protein
MRWILKTQYSAPFNIPISHQHHGWRRRFTIRVGLPCVHGGKTSLGPVADEGKHDTEPQRKWMQLGCRLHETGPVERSHAFAERTLTGREHEHGPQQREGEPQAAQHQEFPGRLERGVAIVKPDMERHRRQRGQLDRDPHDAEVVGHRDEEHREHVRRNQAVELTAHP